MIERHIIIDNVDPVTFYGVNNSNIQLIRNLSKKSMLLPTTAPPITPCPRMS